MKSRTILYTDDGVTLWEQDEELGASFELDGATYGSSCRNFADRALALKVLTENAKESRRLLNKHE